MRGTENDEMVVMIPACSKLYSILQCMRIKRNVLLSFSLCMLARCFGVVSASITAINVAVFAVFLTVA